MLRYVVVTLAIVVSFAGSSPTLAECDEVFPKPGENLKAFEARMDACFAPEIASKGIKALVEDESSRYNAYLRFRRYWEPRLLPSGDFEEYLKKERTYYSEYRRAHGPGRLTGPSTTALRSSSTLSGAWQELGPYVKPPTSVGAEGTGPISFLTFYPPSPSHMLCGSTIGGLWYSTNGGAFWFKTGTDTEIARSGVGTAAFHPTDYHTWFAASSGNNDGEPGWIGLTGGISLTRDEGKTWKQIASQANLGGIWTRVFKIVVDPSNPSRLYAATSNGLFITNNALAGIPVWTVVPGLAGEYVYDFNLRPGAPNCLYAAVATWSGSNLINWRYLYSTNTTTWQDVPGQSAQTLGAIRLLIEVTPAKTDNFYALVIPPGGSPSKLLFYDFGNNQWHVIYGSAQITAAGRHAFGVDRANPNIVYLSEGTEGRRYTYQGTPLFIDFHSTYYSTGTYHPDIECLVPHPYTTNEVWMCHHGGVSVSLNSGQSWKDRTTGIGGAQVIRLADAASDPSYVAVGLYHDGTDVTASTHSPLWAPNWRQFPNAFCDGLRPLIDPTNPGYMWESCQWGAWMMSTDTGATFVGNGPPSPMWVAEAAFNHLNPATQFRLGTGSGGYDTVFRTTDRFTTWDQIVDLHALYPGPFIAWKIYTPETNGNHLLVHLVDKQNSINKLYRTTIANASTASLMSPSAWTELPLPDNRWISAIAFDPVNPNIVYIANSSSSAFSNSATGTHMLFKVDYTNPALHTYNACTPGLCEDLTQNLPNAYTGQDTLAVEQNSNGGIYFGTDFGVFYSDQSSRAAGSGWAELGTSLPHAGSSGVAINTPSRMVRVGTNGRGVWEHDLVSTALTSCTPPPPDMTAWWTFDGGTGAQMHDLVGSDNVGTTINGPAAVTGIVAGALHFNGTNQFVSAAPQADLNVGSGDFAIDAWIRTSGSGVQTIVDKRNAVPVGYTLFLFNGRLGLQMGDRIGSSVCSSNNTSSACTNWITPATWPNAADGNWHHVAASVSRNNATGGRLYVDGWLVLMFDPTIRNQSIDNTTALWIASSHANSSAGQGFFSGDIDEVEIFKRAVTAAEVQAIFNAGGFGKCKCGGNPSNC